MVLIGADKILLGLKPSPATHRKYGLANRSGMEHLWDTVYLPEAEGWFVSRFVAPLFTDSIPLRETP